MSASNLFSIPDDLRAAARSALAWGPLEGHVVARIRRYVLHHPDEPCPDGVRGEPFRIRELAGQVQIARPDRAPWCPVCPTPDPLGLSDAAKDHLSLMALTGELAQAAEDTATFGWGQWRLVRAREALSAHLDAGTAELERDIHNRVDQLLDDSSSELDRYRERAAKNHARALGLAAQVLAARKMPGRGASQGGRPRPVDVQLDMLIGIALEPERRSAEAGPALLETLAECRELAAELDTGPETVVAVRRPLHDRQVLLLVAGYPPLEPTGNHVLCRVPTALARAVSEVTPTKLAVFDLDPERYMTGAGLRDTVAFALQLIADGTAADVALDAAARLR